VQKVPDVKLNPAHKKKPLEKQSLLKKKKIYVDEKFTADEFSLLTQDDDDVVLGKLSEEAYLENLDYNDYIELFTMNYVSPEEMQKSEAIKKYLDNYGRFRIHRDLYK
jgi:hypothetical protein